MDPQEKLCEVGLDSFVLGPWPMAVSCDCGTTSGLHKLPVISRIAEKIP